MCDPTPFLPRSGQPTRVLLRAVRRWRTQAGKAELRREKDRLKGANKALNLNLRAWQASVSQRAWGGMNGAVLRRKKKEVRNISVRS